MHEQVVIGCLHNSMVVKYVRTADWWVGAGVIRHVEHSMFSGTTYM